MHGYNSLLAVQLIRKEWLSLKWADAVHRQWPWLLRQRGREHTTHTHISAGVRRTVRSKVVRTDFLRHFKRLDASATEKLALVYAHPG